MLTALPQTAPVPASVAAHRIAASVVLYHPDSDMLLRLLGAIAGDVDCILLFQNSLVPPHLLAACREGAAPARVEVIGSGVNLGLGAAYNLLAEAARGAGCDLLLLFDQDSDPQPGMPARLAAAFDRAGGRDAGIAAIGPVPVWPDSGAPQRLHRVAGPPDTQSRELIDVAYMISSGSLIDLDALAAIGPFRDDFFIDAIDTEWCFRARARGYRCVMARQETMLHRLGHGLVPVPLLGVRLIDQPAARLFTAARNQVAMMKMAHVPLWWKLTTIGTLGLRLATNVLRRRAVAAAIVRGAWCGLRGRLGPPGSLARHGAP